MTPIDLDADRALRQRVRLERYATILAHVLHFGPERAREVAARFGLDLDTWLAVDAAWTRELGESFRRQQNQQATRFTSTLFRTRTELTLRPVSLEASGEPPTQRGDGDAEPAPIGPVVVVPEGGSPPQRVAASFQLATPAPNPQQPSPQQPGPQQPSPQQPRPQQPPGNAPAPPAAGPPPAPAFAFPATPPAPTGMHKTAALRESKLRTARAQGTMPFDTGPVDNGELPISLEVYAKITARLAQRTERAEVLAEAKLDEEGWQSVARRWSDRLRRDQSLMRKYIELVGQMKAGG